MQAPQPAAMLSDTGAPEEQPIIFEELAFLPSLGITSDSISFTAVSMESDKRICVQEQSPLPGGSAKTGSVAIVDVPSASLRGRFPCAADSAIINPKLPLLALLANKKLEIYDMDKRAKVASCESPDSVVYWRWVSTTMIAFVTKTAVFHWPAVSKTGTPGGNPYKFFDRHATMKAMQMINYRTTSVPDPSNPSRTMPVGCLVGIAKEGDRIVGRMQLFSSEKNTTQTIEGHACSFVRWGKNNSRRLFCYSTRTPSESMFHVYELSPPRDTTSEKPFKKRSTPVYYPPEAAGDFPVAMQVSDKYKVAYIITKYGYIHIFDIHSGELIYMNRISADTVFTTVPSANGGIVGLNKSGQVLSVRLNEDGIASYIALKLDKPRLASRFAARNGLPLTHLPRQLDQYIRQGNYLEAVTLIFQYPNEDLRTQENLQKFISAPVVPGQVTAAMQYFNYAMSRGKLNRYETIELARAVLKQNRTDLLANWLKEDKLDCSEELGDLLANTTPRDAQLMLAVYQKSQAHEKAVRMLMEMGEPHRILAYCDSTGYQAKIDYAAQVAAQLQTNPPQAVALSTALLERNPPMIPVEKVIELFVQAQRLPDLTGVFQMALKHNRPDQGHAQTRFLEMLLSTGQVPLADRIIATNALTFFDYGYISMLCDKAGLFERGAYLRSRMGQRM